MKSFPKILIIFFLTAFIVQLGCLILLLALPQSSRAADIKFTPQISGLDYKFDATDKTTGNIARYVRAIYNYGIGIIGILAAVVLMIGGVLWIVAGGNATQIGEAKSWIGAALTGLVLALTSYLILNTINPALVNLQITQIPGVGKAPEISRQCCYLPSSESQEVEAKEGLSQEECQKQGGSLAPCRKKSCCAHGIEGTSLNPITICGKTYDSGKWTPYSQCDDKSGLGKKECEDLDFFGTVQHLESGKCKPAGPSGYSVCDCI